MEWIVSWLNEAADSWLSFMLNSAIQLTLFILTIMLVSVVLRNRPAGFLYWLWGLVFVKAFIPPAISLPFVENIPISGAISTFHTVMPVLGTGAIGSSSLSVGAILMVMWFIAALSALSTVIARNITFFRRLRESSEFESGAIPASISDSLKEIQVLTNPGVVSPFTCGIIRPRIYLPKEATSWSKQKLASILMHELGHVCRRDFLAGLLQSFIGIVFFFHPLIWVANSKISRLREMACDDFAIQQIHGNAVDYGKSLLEFLSGRTPEVHPGGVANCFHQKKHVMVSRFEYLINRKEAPMSKFRSVDKMIITGLIAFSLVLSVACSDTLDNNVAQNSDQPGKSERILGHDESDTKADQFSLFDEAPAPVGGMQEIMANLEYPKIARLAGIEGRVIVSTVIDESGDVIDTEIIESLGSNGCDEAAVQAVKKTKWMPARLEGKAVKCRVAIPILFKLSKKVKELNESNTNL